MQNDKDRLDVDLGFLEDAKPRDAETVAASSYKINWRNITIIGGIIVALIGWAVIDDNSSSSQRPTSSTSTSAPTYQPTPTYQPPATYDAGTVSNGQFRCSKYDSDRADRLTPQDGATLELEQQELNQRSSALDSMRLEIETSRVDENSSPLAINSFNEKVDQFNAQLSSYKSDAAALQIKTDQFNEQVQAHNNYLLTHCRRGG